MKLNKCVTCEVQPCMDSAFFFQLLGHWGGSRELRAAGVCEGLLLRQGGPHCGHGCAAGEGHSQQRHRHLLDAAGRTRPHGRDGPDGAANPLSAQQRRRGERVREAQVGPALGRGGPQLRGTKAPEAFPGIVVLCTYITHNDINNHVQYTSTHATNLFCKYICIHYATFSLQCYQCKHQGVCWYKIHFYFEYFSTPFSLASLGTGHSFAQPFQSFPQTHHTCSLLYLWYTAEQQHVHVKRERPRCTFASLSSGQTIPSFALSVCLLSVSCLSNALSPPLLLPAIICSAQSLRSMP